MVQEAVGVNREAASMFHKILPIMKHYMLTDYGINESHYGDKNDKLGGAGQRSCVLGAACKETSCLIFKCLESQFLEINTKFKRKGNEIKE